MLFGKNPSYRTGDNKKDSLSNPKILDVNLIKDEVRVVFDWRRNLLVILVVFLVAAALVAELYFGLDWWSQKEMVRAQSITSQLDSLNREIAQTKGQVDAALTYQAKTAAAGQLLTNHVYWTNFLRWLEKNTLSSVKYTDFSGDLSGQYELAANASTYAEVSWQAKILLDDSLVEKVEILTAANGSEGIKNQSGVSFPMSLKIKPDIFKK